LTPLLLNELQHQRQEIAALKTALVEQNAALAARVAQLEAATHRVMVANR